MKKRSAAAVFSTCACLWGSAAHAITGRDLHKLIDEHPEYAGFLVYGIALGYMVGAADVSADLTLDPAHREEMPPDTVIAVEMAKAGGSCVHLPRRPHHRTLVDVVSAHLQAHPETLGEGAEFLAIRALSAAFPCRKL